MPHLDGTTCSKPTPPRHRTNTNTTHTRTPSRREAVRKRLANLFTSSRAKKPISNTNTNTTNNNEDHDNDDDNASNDTRIKNTFPMRIVSPRATQYDLPSTASPPACKQGTFSPEQRHARVESWKKEVPRDDGGEKESVDGRVSGTDVVIARALREGEDGGGNVMPSRDEALTSHPVGKIEEGSDDEEFVTPVSEIGGDGVLSRGENEIAGK